jgi:hypothetical protein
MIIISVLSLSFILTVAAKELLAFEASAVKKRRRVLGLKIIVLIIGQ